MVEDKIALVLKDLTKLKEDLKDIKKDIKEEEKIVSQDYEDLKRTLKDMKKQVKDFEEDWIASLADDDSYNELRETKVKKDEEIGIAMEKLFELIGHLPQKYVEMKVETENGDVRIQIQPEMKLYLNGKEEKKKF